MSLSMLQELECSVVLHTTDTEVKSGLERCVARANAGNGTVQLQIKWPLLQQ